MILQRRSPTSLKFFVLVNGAAITALEITAARILAPYFGTSMPVWGSVIGVTMAALAIGYGWGGKLADRSPKISTLGYLFLIAGVTASLVPLFAKPALSFVLNNILPGASSFIVLVIAGSLIGTIVLFATPILIMGMVSPFAVRIASKQISEVGRTAGSLYSIATVGSILGVFLSSFVALPLLGSRITVAVFSACEILIGALAIAQERFLIILLIPLLSSLTTQPIYTEALVEVETPYQFARIVEENGVREMKFNEGTGTQSIFDLSRRLEVNRYWDYPVLLPYLKPDQTTQRMLMIGTAGATVATNIRDHVTEINVKVTGIEIDPVVANLARRYFGADDRALDFVIADGRVGMKMLNQKFDIILIDAFTQQFYIPPHLTTVEFFGEAKSHLNQGGFLAANVVGTANGPLISAFSTTLDSVFDRTWLIRIPQTLNYLIIASDDPNLFDNFSAPERLQSLAKAFGKRQVFTGSGTLLTDDRAPLEFLTEWEIFNTVWHKPQTRHL